MLEMDARGGDARRHLLDRWAVGEAKVAGLHGVELAAILLGRSPTEIVQPEAGEEPQAYADRAVAQLLRLYVRRWHGGAGGCATPVTPPTALVQRCETMFENQEAAQRRIALLQRIADALGVPVESLTDGAKSTPWNEASALLEAFTAITDVQGRRRVLAIAQEEAARSEGKADAALAVGDGTTS